jgi:FKBP-type peptidyl-prolyl cis-trans isomerase FklB
MSLQELRQRKLNEKRKIAEDFLAANQTKEGVVTTASGLQYLILTEGNGAKPTINDKVTVHYEGKLLNDTIFDSSVKRNKPATFPLKNVIEGWQEGLQYMNEGAKFRFFIPSHLAYGELGAGPIGALETLIFEVELLSIN